MDTRKYEVLLHAVDEGSFLHAGEKLGYTQSGITQMMNGLEREVGFPLLLRSNKGVSLTNEGARLAPLMRELLRLQDHIEQECAQIRGVETGSVRIGSFTSISIQWLPQVIEEFRKLHPLVHVEMLEEGSESELEGWLREGRIDVCFYSLPERNEFDQIELMQDELCALLPKGHPMQHCEVFPMHAFEQEPFLMHKSSNHYDRDIERALQQANISPKEGFSSNFDHFIISMVAHNLGISILPYLMLQERADDIVIKPLEPRVFRRLGIAVRSFKQCSPAVSRFIACAKEIIGRQPPSNVQAGAQTTTR